MTEAEYQTAIRAIHEEAAARGRVLLDYLVTQPPIKLGLFELRAFTDWCLAEGAAQVDIINERTRRQRLAKEQK